MTSTADQEEMEIINEIRQRIASVTINPPDTSYLFQRMSNTIKRIIESPL